MKLRSRRLLSLLYAIKTVSFLAITNDPSRMPRVLMEMCLVTEINLLPSPLGPLFVLRAELHSFVSLIIRNPVSLTRSTLMMSSPIHVISNYSPSTNQVEMSSEFLPISNAMIVMSFQSFDHLLNSVLTQLSRSPTSCLA